MAWDHIWIRTHCVLHIFCMFLYFYGGSFFQCPISFSLWMTQQSAVVLLILPNCRERWPAEITIPQSFSGRDLFQPSKKQSWHSGLELKWPYTRLVPRLSSSEFYWESWKYQGGADFFRFICKFSNLGYHHIFIPWLHAVGHKMTCRSLWLILSKITGW